MTLDDVLVDHFRDRAKGAEPRDQLGDILDGQVVRPIAPARRRRPAAWLGAAAAVALAVGGLVVLAQRDGGGAPASSVPDGPAIDWSNEHVLFTADSFAIEAGGQRFTVADGDLDIDGDPGDDDYQTLELTWAEHGVEMRWYVYFRSDGQQWWSDEFRTYDGAADAEWVEFYGDWFRSPAGQAWHGDLDVSATSDDTGNSARLIATGVTLQPFTEVPIVPDPPSADGTPPALPAGIPSVGAAWPRDGKIALEVITSVMLTECVNEAGYVDYEFDGEALARALGAWEPHPVLGIGTEAAAAAFGYHAAPLDQGLDGYAQTLLEGEREAFYETVMGGNDVTPIPLTVPGVGDTGSSIARGGCWGEVDAAFDRLTVAQEGYRGIVHESGIDQEAVADSTAADPLVVELLDQWSQCVELAVGEAANTPDELARRFAFETGPTSREIEVAVADARCQAEVGLQQTWDEVYARYQRAALGDKAPLFDELALMRADIVERARELLDDRGVTVP